MSHFSEAEIHKEIRVMLNALLPGWDMSESAFKTGLQVNYPAKKLADATWDKVWKEVLASNDVVQEGGRIRRKN